MSELLNFLLDHEEAFKSRGRLSSLYSDFSHSATTNPDGYQANVAAWKKALTNAARAGVIPSGGTSNNLLSIKLGEELARALTSQERGRPLALGAAIDDGVSKKEFISIKDFLTSTTSIYHKSWAISPWQILSWGLRQLGVLGEGGDAHLTSGDFVITANVEAAANSIISQISSKSNVERIFSHAEFNSTFAHVLSPTHALSSFDKDIILKYLARDRVAISYDASTIKFASSTASSPEPITEQDTTIASLRTLLTSLNTQILLLESRITQFSDRARVAVASKARNTALAALRSKKLAESTLAQRLDTLRTLEDTYSKIEAAADNVEIVRVMQSSAAVLRSLNKQVGGAEGVEGVVDTLREEMGHVDEVSGVLNEVGAEGTAVDEGEIDEEFEALERAEREKHEAAERKAEEARLAAEAEKTRARLAELDTEKEGPNALPSAPKEDPLAESIQGIQNMSLESGAAPSGDHAKAGDASSREREPATSSS